jgi:hypothetical protein
MPEVVKITKLTAVSFEFEFIDRSSKTSSKMGVSLKQWKPISDFFSLDSSSTKGEDHKKIVLEHLKLLSDDKFPILVRKSPIKVEHFETKQARAGRPTSGERMSPGKKDEVPCCVKVGAAPDIIAEGIRTCAAHKKDGTPCCSTVDGTRTFCTAYHNKLQFLVEEGQTFENQHDVFGVFLCMQMLKDGLCDNPLQPKVHKDFSPPKVPKFKNLSCMIKYFKPYRAILQSALGVNVDGSANVKVRDQELRAQKLAEQLVSKPGKTQTKYVRYMDGHGNLTLCLLEAIESLHGKTFLNSLTLHLVDIEQSVTDWHSLVFPCDSVLCLTESIYHAQIPHLDTTFIYMNFCGIGRSKEGVCEFLDNHPRNCMLSFCISRSGVNSQRYINSYTTSNMRNFFKGKSSRAASTWQLEKITSERNDFVTFLIHPKSNTFRAEN